MARQAWSGMARQAWHGWARKGKEGRGEARHSKAGNNINGQGRPHRRQA